MKNKFYQSNAYILARHIKNKVNNLKLKKKLSVYQNRYTFENFDFNCFKEDVFNYLKSNKGDEIYLYKFSHSCESFDIYSSVYALMTLGLFNNLNTLTNEEKIQWGKYLLSFQQENGFFVDHYLDSPLSDQVHYWGWYHLLPHLLIALSYLNIHPKYDFHFLYEILDKQSIENWLESRKWEENYLEVSNEVMNITILLQYSRDIFENKKAEKYVVSILNWLKNNQIDPHSGLWGNNTLRSSFDISKAIKTTYHFIPMYLFENDLEGLNLESIIHYTLKTQNSFGTYGPCCLTDGCEDIDSLYLLTQLPIPDKYEEEVQDSVKNFFGKIFINMNNNGGFVFKRLQSFQYADSKLTSKVDESNMFGTWFRTLSIAYAAKYLQLDNDFYFANVSGYQFYRSFNR